MVASCAGRIGHPCQKNSFRQCSSCPFSRLPEVEGDHGSGSAGVSQSFHFLDTGQDFSDRHSRQEKLALYNLSCIPNQLSTGLMS